ncbi:uncharacterized mitochondrial protein AtMg00860-like [Stegodyphus dumicola]|uniref:uncharacterized mitochondrial protein AtMg00860-like n=1 Tax=Stegodyphus dumicola TaxID=202533 RepID=UPI0015AA41F5|nr:uncharacterized mitochondrial protein AtMg00860-like [Stegodyphus dumicola]
MLFKIAPFDLHHPKHALDSHFLNPKTAKQVRSFLGLTGYFRKFIQHYAKIAKPLSDLLRESTPFEFGPAQQHAFLKLKEALSSDPVLHLYQQGLPLQLHCDASKYGYGSVLLQQITDVKVCNELN